MRGVPQALADRDAVQTPEAELPIEILPWRQSKRHTDSDLGKYDSLVADAGYQKAGEAEVEPVQHDDCRAYSTQFLHGTIRFSQPARGAMDKNH